MANNQKKKNHREAWEVQKENFVCIRLGKQQLSGETSKCRTLPGLCMSAERKGLKGRAWTSDVPLPEEPASLQMWARPMKEFHSEPSAFECWRAQLSSFSYNISLPAHGKKGHSWSCSLCSWLVSLAKAEKVPWVLWDKVERKTTQG